MGGTYNTYTYERVSFDYTLPGIYNNTASREALVFLVFFGRGFYY